MHEHPWCLPEFKDNVCGCWDSYKKLHPTDLRGCKCDREGWPHGLLPIRDVAQTTSTKVRKLVRWHKWGMLKIYRCDPFNYRFVSLHEAHDLVMFFWRKWMTRRGYMKEKE